MKTLVLGAVLLTVAACASDPANDRTVVTTTAPMMAQPGVLVRCESQNNTRNTCGVDARNRLVTINQQLSDNPCIVGKTWGVSSDRNEIWVDDGCRAEFQVGGSTVAATALGYSVVCESQNNTRAQCPVDTSYGVQLVRQISENGCVRGNDWGFDQNGIWVDHGCRAEFVVGGDPRFTPRTTAAGTRILCESQDRGMHRCPADTYWGVTLARQISDSVCVRGATWGYDANGIWVNNGCRAEFVLGY